MPLQAGGHRMRDRVLDLLGLLAILLPLVYCLASDAVHTSLWLDEITYHYYENDPALRSAELGRPGSAVAPYLGVFFHADVQRLIHAVVRPLGLTLRRDPELYLRFGSIVWFALAAAAIYIFLRRRLPGRLDATLAGLAFSSMPIFLHYAFEARVYAMTLMLVVLLLAAVDAASTRPSAGRLALVALIGLLTAQSHAWTLCLFAGLLLAAAVQGIVERRLTAWGRAAATASFPAIALIGAETLYIKATDPGDPLFPPFAPQDPLVTLWHLLFSSFTGVRLTMFVGEGPASTFLQLAGGAALLGLGALALRMGSDRPDGNRPRAWTGAAVAALGVCFLLAVTHGFYMHARYSVPLVGAFVFAVARFPSRAGRLLLVLLVSCNLGLLPAAVEGLGTRGSMKQVAGLIERHGGREVGVVCQHVLGEGFALPVQAVVLDFYLNVLHPEEPPIPIYELPDLVPVNGRRGVYDLFAGGPRAYDRYLRSLPDLWREKREILPRHLFVLQQAWNVEAGNRQSRDFARAMLEAGAWQVVAKRTVTGFPPTFLVEIRRTDATMHANTLPAPPGGFGR
jgi:hypothetical protein